MKKETAINIVTKNIVNHNEVTALIAPINSDESVLLKAMFLLNVELIQSFYSNELQMNSYIVKVHS